MAECVALLAGRAVVAHEKRGVEMLVQSFHHHPWLIAPAADKLHIVGHLFGVEVDAGAVGVPDHHPVRSGGTGPFRGGQDLQRHFLTAALIVVPAGAQGLPGDGKGRAFKVR